MKSKSTFFVSIVMVFIFSIISVSIANAEDQVTDIQINARSMSKDHEEVVSSFVHSLLNIAERENERNNGIGERVRIIAESQNDSASTTASAMEKVNERGSFRSFFSGGDYKNLGLIKEEIATTTANIIELKEVLKDTTNKTDRIELNLQIENLKVERAKVTAYVKENETKFSVFGWLNKLFIK